MITSNVYARTSALDETVRKTLVNTFVTIGGMWLITTIASYLSLGLNLGLAGTLALAIGSFGVLFAVRAFRNSGVGVALLALFAGMQGVLIGPLMNHYLAMAGGTQMVTTAAGLTALATGACAAYCITTRKSFSQLGGFLFAGLIVLLVASVIGMFVQSSVLHLVISTIACLLFTAYMLYDIGAVLSGQETSYISAALSIYLDMLNLFLHLLRILGLLGASDD